MRSFAPGRVQAHPYHPAAGHQGRCSRGAVRGPRRGGPRLCLKTVTGPARPPWNSGAAVPASDRGGVCGAALTWRCFRKVTAVSKGPRRPNFQQQLEPRRLCPLPGSPSSSYLGPSQLPDRRRIEWTGCSPPGCWRRASRLCGSLLPPPTPIFSDSSLGEVN